MASAVPINIQKQNVVTKTITAMLTFINTPHTHTAALTKAETQQQWVMMYITTRKTVNRAENLQQVSAKLHVAF